MHAKKTSAAAFFAALLLLINGFPCTGRAAASGFANTETEEAKAWGLSRYDEYLSAHEQVNMAGKSVEISAADYTSAAGAEVASENGKKVVSCSGEGSIEWMFHISEAGFYNITFTYRTVPSSSGFEGGIERSLLINGNIPYREAAYLSFARIYEDAGEITADVSGNDLRPEQREKSEYRSCVLRDPSEMHIGYLKFYFKAGENRLGLNAVRGQMILEKIRLSNEETIPAYQEYTEQMKGRPDESDSEKVIELRAECPDEKSDYTIVPVNDRSSAATFPNDPVLYRLNTIGGNKWMLAGQGLSWSFTVDKPGFYTIALRFRQNVYPGAFSTRRMLIDDEVLFQEAQNIRFAYSGGWQVQALSAGGRALSVYLTPGEHKLTLEVALGDMAEVLRRVETALASLNNDYRRLLTIIGATPDVNRDYAFEQLMPDVIRDFKTQADAFRDIVGILKTLSSGIGANTAVLERTAGTLEKMHGDPQEIAGRYLAFKDHLAALGTWLLTYRQQPLELDTVYILPKGAGLPKANASPAAELFFQLKAFLSSFFVDYRSIGASFSQEEMDAGKVITVWAATGRDQSQIIQRLADESFGQEKRLRVNLQLVAQGTLLPAVLAGIGPDVSLSAAATDPVNYAVRKAVVDLTGFSGLSEVTARFDKSALIPYTFNGQLFALPETQSFPLFFYRKDIFQELGITVPKTWEEFYEIVFVLQKNHMQIGMQWQSAMSMFLYQNGGSYYNGAFTKSALLSDQGVSAFKETVNLYKLYRFPVEFDFANRFRGGEMPAGIVDYTMYNQLTVFAPEIKGLWGFAAVPGTADGAGGLDFSAPATGTGVIMLRGAKNRDNAWEFMKWWTSAAVQSRFGVEMESAMGPAAKQPSANIKAAEQMRWTSEELKVIQAQREKLIGIPEVPGGYYTGRALEFAFTTVYAGNVDPVTTLEDNIAAVDEEIARKRQEFGLD